ncbi:MAG: hypothetical protein WCD32_02855 [Azonexus sp.]
MCEYFECFFTPAWLALACFTEDFLPAEALGDFVGALAVAVLVLLVADLAAGTAAVLPVCLVSAAALESAFFATGAGFFDSVAAWPWAFNPKPSNAPQSTTTLNPCFICDLLPIPCEF